MVGPLIAPYGDTVRDPPQEPHYGDAVEGSSHV